MQLRDDSISGSGYNDLPCEASPITTTSGFPPKFCSNLQYELMRRKTFYSIGPTDSRT